MLAIHPLNSVALSTLRSVSQSLYCVCITGLTVGVNLVNRDLTCLFEKCSSVLSSEMHYNSGLRQQKLGFGVLWSHICRLTAVLYKNTFYSVFDQAVQKLANALFKMHLSPDVGRASHHERLIWQTITILGHDAKLQPYRVKLYE